MSPQTFLIRRSEKEGVLRSIGAPPNGIVGLQAGEGEASWVINSKRQPPNRHGTIEVVHSSGEEAELETEPLELPDLVSGCESQRELFSLCATIISTTQVTIGELAPRRDFPTIHAIVELLEETLMAVEEALLERGGGP